MSDYSIDMTKDSCFFKIESETFDTIPYYMQKTFLYGTDDGEISNLAFYTDIRTCEILAIICSNKRNAREVSYVIDYSEYDDLKEKRKASFITPRGVGITYDYIQDFMVYYSKDTVKIIIEDGKPYYCYDHGRMKIYYDNNYELLEIYIKDLTSEEYEALKRKSGPTIRLTL